MTHQNRNKWEQALDYKLIELKKCQEQNGYMSCLSCPELLKCNLREEYVRVVYESMNKNSDGGFEF